MFRYSFRQPYILNVPANVYSNTSLLFGAHGSNADLKVGTGKACDLPREAYYRSLQNVVQVGGNQPATWKRSTHIPKVFAIRIQLFRCTCDVTALAALCIRVLRAAFEKRRISFR